LIAESLIKGTKHKKWTENIVNEMMCQKETKNYVFRLILTMI